MPESAYKNPYAESGTLRFWIGAEEVPAESAKAAGHTKLVSAVQARAERRGADYLRISLAGYLIVVSTHDLCTRGHGAKYQLDGGWLEQDFVCDFLDGALHCRDVVKVSYSAGWKPPEKVPTWDTLRSDVTDEQITVAVEISSKYEPAPGDAQDELLLWVIDLVAESRWRVKDRDGPDVLEPMTPDEIRAFMCFVYGEEILAATT